MNIVLYGNGDSENHGCEAIARGTVALCGKNEYTVLSAEAQTDDRYGLSSFATIMPAVSEQKRNLRFVKAYLKLKLKGDYTEMDGLSYLSSINEIKSSTNVALSVGGDNYCYEGTGIYPWLNREYHRHGIKTVLWGCSVEPSVVAKPEIKKDFRLYDHIVARESITYDAVVQVTDHVTLAPDPAFFMKPEPCEVDGRFGNGPIIGINISPMIISNENSAGMAYENYRRLVEYILCNTGAGIALIPHVVWSSNDDRTILRRLYDDFGGNERLILVEDHNAPQLKYIISQCDFFVGARTHATIAAYSTCVPTLVVGYSVKARGIARDLFGDENGYVLPVQDLKEPDELIKAFEALYEKRDSIRQHLIDFMPQYMAQGQKAVEVLNQLMNKD